MMRLRTILNNNLKTVVSFCGIAHGYYCKYVCSIPFPTSHNTVEFVDILLEHEIIYKLI